MAHSALTQILLLLAAVVLVVFVMRRLKLPPILGYLAVGMLLGPYTPGPTADLGVTALLADFGVVFLVFTLGLEFSLPRLVAMKWEVLGLGGGQVIVTSGLAALIAWKLGVPPAVAAVLGGAVAMSSTAIVVRQLGEQAEVNRTHGRLAVAILVFQDLAFVPFLALTSAISNNADPEGIAENILKTLLEGSAALLIVLAAGRWLLRPLFHEIARTRTPELFLLSVLLVALGSAWATESVGLSLALGAFLAGVMLAETEFRHQVETVIRPFRDVLLGLFFITIGMLLNIDLLVDQLFLVTGLLLALLVGKTLIVTVLALKFAGNTFKALRTGLAVSVGGEFGFALLTILMQGGMVQAHIVQPLLAAIVLSMVVSALIIRHNKSLARWLLREDGPPKQTALAREHAGTRALAEREHVLICGFGRVGQNIARILEQNGYEYLAVDLDAERVRAARQAGDPVIYGDAEQEEVLDGAGLKQASVVVISFSDGAQSLKILQAVRKLRPQVPVLVRTQDDSRLAELQANGATSVVPETFEAGLMLVWHVLVLLGEPVDRVVKTIGDIRSNRYEIMRSVIRQSQAGALEEVDPTGDAALSVVLPPGAWAVGRTVEEVGRRGGTARVGAIRREGIVGRDPALETLFREGDIVVLYGNPKTLEHSETVLLMG